VALGHESTECNCPVSMEELLPGGRGVVGVGVIELRFDCDVKLVDKKKMHWYIFFPLLTFQMRLLCRRRRSTSGSLTDRHA